MPIAIREDKVLGAACHNDFEGVKLKREFVVSGLRPLASNALFYAITLGAVDASTGFRIPQYGEPHPTVSGQFVSSVDAVPFENSNDKAIVTVNYGWYIITGPQSVQVSISSSTCNVPINWDPNTGEFFSVTWTHQIDPEIPNDTKHTVRSGVIINALVPETVLEITRLELRSPLKAINAVKGRTNRGPWQGEAAFQWLMRDVQARSMMNGAYLVSYCAACRPTLGWTQLAYYTDPTYGLPPDAIMRQIITRKQVEGKTENYGTDLSSPIDGIFSYSPPSADFDQLGLPDITA